MRCRTGSPCRWRHRRWARATKLGSGHRTPQVGVLRGLLRFRSPSRRPQPIGAIRSFAHSSSWHPHAVLAHPGCDRRCHGGRSRAPGPMPQRPAPSCCCRAVRATPQSVAALASLAAEAQSVSRGDDASATRGRRRFRGRTAQMPVFALFHPSPFLTEKVDPLSSPGLSLEDIRRSVRRQLTDAIKGVLPVRRATKKQRTRNRPSWIVLANIERRLWKDGSASAAWKWSHGGGLQCLAAQLAAHRCWSGSARANFRKWPTSPSPAPLLPVPGRSCDSSIRPSRRQTDRTWFVCAGTACGPTLMSRSSMLARHERNRRPTRSAGWCWKGVWSLRWTSTSG